MSEELKNENYSCPVVKIPDAPGIVVFEFENKGTIMCPSIAFWKAIEKYMSNDMEWLVKH